MRTICWFGAILWAWSVLPCAAADAPRQIGPFVLGHNIGEVSNYVDMRTDLPIRYAENIKEVEIMPLQGFKSGLIAYTSCQNPGQIVRIKLKYADDSRSFFDALRKRIEDRFGKFEEYRGDPFQVVIGWKKSFTDRQGNRISLIIQHNRLDDEEKMGNSIKLTMTNLLEADFECQKARRTEPPQTPIQIPGMQSWELFIPR
jgi:hypothetical protein